MSERHSPSDPAMSGADPSMDEILASIRRILNEDAPPKHEAAPAEEDVLMLDSTMLVNEEPMNAEANKPVAFPVEAPHPLPPARPQPEPVQAMQHPPAEAPVAAPIPLDPSHGLVAPTVAAAATSSVGELVRTLSSNRGTSTSRTGPTIEDLVRDEIRPVLKAWLDTHLPPIVERMVQIEIERVIARSTP